MEEARIHHGQDMCYTFLFKIQHLNVLCTTSIELIYSFPNICDFLNGI